MTITDPAIVKPTIDTASDVRAWFDAMLRAGVSFHPEDTFREMRDGRTGDPSFAPRDAARMDARMVALAAVRDHEAGQ